MSESDEPERPIFSRPEMPTLQQLAEIAKASGNDGPPVNRGGSPRRKPKKLPSAVENTPVAPAANYTISVIPISDDPYAGLQRMEKLFKALKLGDRDTILETIRAKTLKQDGREEPAISLVPHEDNPYHSPEPLLQRAMHSHKLQSVLTLVEVAGKYDKKDRMKFINGQRFPDKETVLHDLVASIPADEKLKTTLNPKSEIWNPGPLLSLFVTMGADMDIKNSDGKTALQLAKNSSVQQLLSELDKDMKERMIQQDNAREEAFNHRLQLLGKGPRLATYRGRAV